MRWATVFALFLLAGIPPCSSAGSQSASPLSTTDPPTADIMNLTRVDDTPLPSIDDAPDAVVPSTAHHPTTDEDYDGSASLAEEVSSMTAITSSERVMESEASYVTYNDRSDETSREADEESTDAGASAAPSTSDDSLPAPTPYPSIGPQVDIKSQALVGGSASTPTVNFTAGLAGLPSSEIDNRLEQAKLQVASLELQRNEAREKWEKKYNESVVIDRDYEEKREKWEKLDKIAEEKEEDWRNIKANASKTARDYDTAKSARESLDKLVVLEREKLDKYPEKIRKANEEVAVVQGRPNRLLELKRQKQAKEDGKPALDREVLRLSGLVDTAHFNWERDHGKELANQAKFDLNNCNDTAKATTDCTPLIEIKKNAKKALEKYEEALGNLNGPKGEQDNYDIDMFNLQGDIDDLESKNDENDLKAANRKVSDLVRKQQVQSDKVEQLVTKQTKAVAEERRKEVAKIEAEQKAAGDTPPETITARDEEFDAKMKMNSAKQAKDNVDKEVMELKTELDKTQSSFENAESEVKSLTELYRKTKKEEEETEAQARKKTIGIVIGASSSVLLLLGAAGGVFLCYKRKLLCFGYGTRDNQGAKNTDVRKASLKNIRTSTSKNPDVIAATRDMTRNWEQPPPAKIPRFDDPLPDLSKVPFVPGEKPFKIPAKFFKWLGVMRRRSRWHGEPRHDFEGQTGVTHVDNISFDPNANYATEIGPNEIIEDGGPASDSDRSEWLNNLDEWEKGHKALLAAQEEARKFDEENKKRRNGESTGQALTTMDSRDARDACANGEGRESRKSASKKEGAKKGTENGAKTRTKTAGGKTEARHGHTADNDAIGEYSAKE